MSDANTITAEFRSWEWDLVLQYEEGSIPAIAWNQGTLTTIATWYAKNLSREQATQRYEQYYQRNRRRLTNRLSESSVVTKALEAVDAVWQSLLQRALEAQSSSARPADRPDMPNA